MSSRVNTAPIADSVIMVRAEGTIFLILMLVVEKFTKCTQVNSEQSRLDSNYSKYVSILKYYFRDIQYKDKTHES